MVFSLVEYICFDLAFSSVTQFGGSGPFVVMQEFAVGAETVDIVLTKIIHLQEHLIVIIPPPDPWQLLSFQTGQHPAPSPGR